MDSAPDEQVQPWQYEIRCQIGPEGQLSVTQPDHALARRLGYPMEDLAGATSWMTKIPEDDVERSLDAVKALSQGEVWEGRVRAEASTGETVILQVRSTPERHSEGGMTVTVEARDVTEIATLEAALAEKEARLKLLTQEIAVVMWTTDDSLRFTWFSGSALEPLGLEENALVGTSFFELFETEDTTFVPIAAHRAALEGESATYEVEWRERRWRSQVEPLRDTLDRVVGVLGVAIDLTRLMQVTRMTLPDGPPVRDADLDLSSISDDGLERLVRGDLMIDPERFEVTKNGRKIDLTVTEFKLLMEFMRRSGRVLSRQVLAERVWGYDFYGNSTSVTMAISRLRDKIEDDPAHPVLIETVRGLGYRFTGDV